MKNVGIIDKIARYFLAVILILLEVFYFKSDAMKIISFALAIVMIAVSLTSFCPIYKIFGINTKK